MTVPSTARRAGPFLGNGVTTTFSFSFKTFAAGDLVVTRTASNGVETTLVLNSDYSVSLNADQDASPGGTITYPLSGSPLAAGQKLTIVGDLDYEQTTDLLGGGAFNARVIEDTFDRTVIQIQQLEERLDRAVSVPVSSTASAELPAPEGSALLGWNGGGTALQNVPLSSLATAVAYGSMRYQTFVGNGTTTTFALTHDPATVANLDVSIAGVVRVPGTDYTLVGQNVVFTSAPPNGVTILVRYGQALGSVPSDSNDISFQPAGTSAVTRTAQAKMRDVVSVLDFGADPTGVSDSRAAFQAAVTAVIAAGRGTVYVPEGTYLINGTTSSDSILNGVLFPWDNNYDLRPYVRIVGDGGVTIKAGSNGMAVFRVSTTFVEISNICIDGNGKTNVTGIGVWPENTGAETITAPRSQSYFLSHSVTIKNCFIGIDFQPGVTDTSNRQSGCFYHSVYNYHGNTNTQHLVFSYPYDYNTAPSATNQNYTTRSGFHNCSFLNGNVGIYAKGVGDIYFYNTNVELINSTSNARGTAPLATPTGLYVSSQGTFAKVVQMFGGYIEACTETIYNGRTNGVMTVGTIYATPTTGNFRNIVRLGSDGMTLAYDSANATVNVTPNANGGLDIMADPANAKAATFIQLGADGTYNFALQPYFRASGPNAVTTGGNFHAVYSDDASNATFRGYHTASSGTLRGERWTFPNASPNDTSSWFHFAEDATETKLVVWSNGTVQNRTGTFSAISDAKLKENIKTAPSYWSKFKAYEFVNFSFKNDPEKIKMLGVVAQQIEQVSPGLVYETPDTEQVIEQDENGEEVVVDRFTGTTTKAVKSSIMSTISQVVLQEAQKRIEELEARVAALEAK